MKYTIEYKPSENHNLNNILFIYDFGYVKGFLYDNTFTMYKLLDKENTLDIVELYEGIIPKSVFSIEKYSCEYSDGIYKLQDFDVVVKRYLHVDSQPFLPSLPPSPHSLPLHQQAVKVVKEPRHNIPRNNQVAVKPEIHLNGVNEKVQPVEQQTQYFSMSPNAVKPQWISLEQLMKGPLVSVDPIYQKQPTQLKQHLTLSTPKLSSSSHVRPRRGKVETHLQKSNPLT